MRTTLLTTISIITLAFAGNAVAAGANAAVNASNKPIVDSAGHCVHTKWEGTDPCAPQAKTSKSSSSMGSTPFKSSTATPHMSANKAANQPVAKPAAKKHTKKHAKKKPVAAQ